MNKYTRACFAVIPVVALAFAFAIWTPAHSQPAQPASKMKMDGKMIDGKMMECCQMTMDQKQKMSDDMKAQDAELTAHVAKMNSASEGEKISVMAAVITHMAEQHVAMNARMAKMDEQKMKHMMQHMEMGKDSMAMCPMMKDMVSK